MSKKLIIKTPITNESEDYLLNLPNKDSGEYTIAVNEDVVHKAGYNIISSSNYILDGDITFGYEIDAETGDEESSCLIFRHSSNGETRENCIGSTTQDGHDFDWIFDAAGSEDNIKFNTNGDGKVYYNEYEVATKHDIEALPEPMIFKGTVGDPESQATISDLPPATIGNLGWVYKCITNGTYYPSIVLHEGDTVVCAKTSDSPETYEWVVIPSGDEPDGTVTSVGTTAEANSGLTLTGGPITSSGTIIVGLDSGYELLNSNTDQTIDGKKWFSSQANFQSGFNSPGYSTIYQTDIFGRITHASSGGYTQYGLTVPSTSGWTADKTIAVDEDVIHKGTSQSSPAAAETRYGNLTIDGDLSVGNGSGTTRSFSLFSGGGTHTLKPDLNSTLRTLRYSRRGSTAGNIDIDFPNKSGILATTDDIPANIKDGTGTNAIYQAFDTGYDNTIDMSAKNPNAWELYQAAGHSGDDKYITKGATGQYATSLGGISAAAGKRALADGTNTIAIGKYSHAEGDNSVALGNESHAEGNQTVTNGSAAHSEGFSTQAIGNNAHAEGAQTIAYAKNAHSEGYASTVKDNYIIVDHGITPQPIPPEPIPPTPPTPEELDALNGSGAHSEGHNTFVLGCGAHAEGDSTKAYGRLSHAEGRGTQTGELILRKTEDNKDYYTPNQDKQFQHAEGELTKAIGHTSHAGGYETIAGYNYQTVVGKYNANKEHTLFEVGYGWSNSERHNALEVYDDGHVEAGASTLSINSATTLTTKDYVDAHTFPNCPTTTNGNYILRATVNNGAVTYEWVEDNLVRLS